MNEFRRLIALGSLIIVAVSGCATYQPMASNAVQEGDRVRVTTVDGETIQMRITQVNDVQLSGARRSVLREEIEQLERVVESEYRALTWVLVGVAAVVLTSETPDSPEIRGPFR